MTSTTNDAATALMVDLLASLDRSAELLEQVAGLPREARERWSSRELRAHATILGTLADVLETNAPYPVGLERSAAAGEPFAVAELAFERGEPITPQMQQAARQAVRDAVACRPAVSTIPEATEAAVARSRYIVGTGPDPRANAKRTPLNPASETSRRIAEDDHEIDLAFEPSPDHIA